MWDTVGYGIPCLNLNDDSLLISLSCLKSGETLHEFSVSSPDKYKILDRHFHIFITERSRTSALSFGLNTPRQHNLSSSYNHHMDSVTYGLSFAHEKVADRFYKAVIQLLPKRFPSSSSFSRDRLSQSVSLSSSLTITPEEMTDLPALIQSDSYLSQSFLVEEAGALTSSGKFPNPLEEESSPEDEQSLRILQHSYTNNKGEEVIEDVDASRRRQCVPRKLNSFLSTPSLAKRRGSLDHSSAESLLNKSSSLLKQRSESMEDVRISYPTTVRHLAHISQETPFHTLKQVINTGICPGSVLESDIEKHRYEKLKRTPSAPCRVRNRNSSFVSSTPAILVTNTDATKKSFPKPPPQVSDFDSLVKKLQSAGEIDRQSEFTSSTQAWQESFHCAVSNLIRKKIYDDPNNSKLLSFTQSGREETSERPSSRTASMIIHDHGIVCL